MTAPTARQLTEEGARDYGYWCAAGALGNYAPTGYTEQLAADAAARILRQLDTGHIGPLEFWAMVTVAQPCACWSCDHQCGGSPDPDSCGMTEPDEIGRLLCAACRDRADVVDDQRHGVKVIANHYGQVFIDVDTWGHPGGRLLMAPATARELAGRLLAMAELAGQ